MEKYGDGKRGGIKPRKEISAAVAGDSAGERCGNVMRGELSKQPTKPSGKI